MMPTFEKLNLRNSFTEFEKAKTLIPGGVMGIRRPYNFVPGEYPIYFDHAKGGTVYDIDGNKYYDFMCAYGPIIIGHREKEIDDCVIAQMQEKGFCFTLTQTYQNRLAEKFNELIPCAEMSLFVTTGSDATTLAIRLSRAYTGKKKVVRCGYHGWHDWCVEVKGGIPKKLYEDVSEFKYNDIESLEQCLKENKDDTAAVIITPLGHPLALKIEEPKPGFLKDVKALAHKYGAVLIFDEIRSGFRVSIGGAQKYYGVTPDMAVFGKAMANGYPISAVTGKKEILKEAEANVFVSSTFFPNSLSYVASLKTIEILQRDKILDNIWEKGKRFNTSIAKILEQHSEVGAELSGIPPMMYISFEKDEKGLYKKKRNDFYALLVRRGIFLQPYHHGYICYRHTEEDLNNAVQAIEESMLYLRDSY